MTRRLMVLACAAAMLLAGCGSGPLDRLGDIGFGRRLVANDWRLLAISPDQRVLRVQTEYGGEASGCNRWVGAEVDENDERVSVRMLVSKAIAPGACTDELVMRGATVRLDEPLGGRKLAGCGGVGRSCRAVSSPREYADPPPYTVAVTQGAVVLAGPFGVAGLDPEDGALRWRASPERSAGRLALLHAAHGLVFVQEPDGAVLALDAADGAERWRRPPGAFAWPPSGAPELPIVVRDEAGLSALDPLTGQERWSRSAPGASGPFTVGRAGVALLASDPYESQGQEVVLLDLADGRERWSTAVEERLHEIAATDMGVLAAGPIVRYGWDADGLQRWRLPPLAEFARLHVTEAGPVAASGEAVFFDEVTGAERRRIALAPGGAPAGLAVERDRLLVVDQEGTLRRLDLDGLVRDVLPLGGVGGMPASGHGVIAVPTHLGVLVFGEDGRLRWWWVAPDPEDADGAGESATPDVVSG